MNLIRILLLVLCAALSAARVHAQADDAPTSPDAALLSDDDVLSEPAEVDAPADEPVRMSELIDDEEELEIPVVVTGARLERAQDLSVVATEVIDRDEIEESGARNAAELLEERAGLQMQSSFRGTELWLRGLDPEYSLVLIDGDRPTGRSGGAIDLGRFGVESIERVEIVRGPSSALYGSDAIGGVVNLITRESDRDLELGAAAAYGSNNTIDVTAFGATRPDPRLRLRVNGGFHFADAFRRGDAESEVTAGSGRLQWSLGGQLDYRPDTRHRFRARADYGQLTLTGVDAGAGAALYDRTQQQEQLQVALEHRITGADRVELRTRVSYSQFREQYLLDQRGSQQLDDYQDNREHLGQITSLLYVPLQGLGSHGLTFGSEQLFQGLDSERLTTFGQRARFAAFAQDEWVPFEEGETSLTVVPGLRYDVDSQFGDQLSPKLAVRFDAVSQLVFRASYGRGFRAPSFQQLFLRFENPTVGYVVSGNPDLGAESAHSVDASVAWTPVPELRLFAAFFRNDLENMIANVTAGDGAAGQLLSYDNIASAWTMGLESTASLRIERWLRASVGYTFTETWDGENERLLEGRARHRLTFSSRFEIPDWGVSLVARSAVQIDRAYYVDDDGDGVEEQLFADPIAQVDLRLAKSFDRYLELFVGVDNLLDAGDRFTVLRPLLIYGGARGRYF